MMRFRGAAAAVAAAAAPAAAAGVTGATGVAAAADPTAVLPSTEVGSATAAAPAAMVVRAKSRRLTFLPMLPPRRKAELPKYYRCCRSDRSLFSAPIPQ